MRYVVYAIVLVCAGLAGGACGGPEVRSGAQGKEAGMAMQAASEAPQVIRRQIERTAFQDGNSPADTALAQWGGTSPDRYLIKRASVSLESDDVAATVELIIEAARLIDGYVASMQDHTDGLGRNAAMIEIRVPQTELESSMLQLETFGRVMSRQITSEDVTEDFLDTEARLRNLKQTEERLLGHLAKAIELEEILKAEKEISRVRAEVEQLEGRMRHLSQRIAFSSIQITVNETPKPGAVVPPETYSTGKVFGDASRALVSALRVVWTVAIWIGVWAAIWVPSVVLVWLLLRLRRRVA